MSPYPLLLVGTPPHNYWYDLGTWRPVREREISNGFVGQQMDPNYATLPVVALCADACTHIISTKNIIHK